MLAPVGERGRAALSKSGSDLILVKGGGDSLVVHLADFERFEREFFIANALMASGGAPERPAHGANEPAWVVEYRSYEGDSE
jgi:hypothetical protein